MYQAKLQSSLMLPLCHIFMRGLYYYIACIVFYFILFYCIVLYYIVFILLYCYFVVYSVMRFVSLFHCYYEAE